MKDKYIKYINHIVNDIQAPYFKNMEDQYGLRPDEYVLVLCKVFNQPVTIKGKSIFDHNDNEIYYEDSDGNWYKQEYDHNGNVTFQENSNGFWFKREYDQNNNKIYYEDSNGYIVDNR